jgi:hypothetical protein
MQNARDRLIELAAGPADAQMLALVHEARTCANVARAFAIGSRAKASRIAAQTGASHQQLRVMDKSFQFRNLELLGDSAVSHLEVAKFVRDCTVMVKACMQYLVEAKRFSIDVLREFEATRMDREFMPGRIGTLPPQECRKMPKHHAMGTIKKHWSLPKLLELSHSFTEDAVQDVCRINKDARTIFSIALRIEQTSAMDQTLTYSRCD